MVSFFGMVPLARYHATCTRSQYVGVFWSVYVPKILSVWFSSEKKTVEITGVGLIGRSTFNNVTFVQNNVYRLQCTVFGNSVGTTVVDLGSLSGTHVLTKTSTYFIGRPEVYADHHSVTIPDQFIHISFSGNTVLINPPMCTTCEERPKAGRFSCGHFTLCGICVTKVRMCPICRNGVLTPNHDDIWLIILNSRMT